jgi:hypothetical protein
MHPNMAINNLVRSVRGAGGIDVAQAKERTIDGKHYHFARNRVAGGRTPGDGRR